MRGTGHRPWAEPRRPEATTRSRWRTRSRRTTARGLRFGAAFALAKRPTAAPLRGRQWAPRRRTVRWCVLLLLCHDRESVDLGVICVSLLPSLDLRGDGLAGSKSRSHDLRPWRLGTEGERGTPTAPDVVGCLTHDVLERVRVGPETARGLGVQPRACGRGVGREAGDQLDGLGSARHVLQEGTHAFEVRRVARPVPEAATYVAGGDGLVGPVQGVAGTPAACRGGEVVRVLEEGSREPRRSRDSHAPCPSTSRPSRA